MVSVTVTFPIRVRTWHFEASELVFWLQACFFFEGKGGLLSYQLTIASLVSKLN